MTTHRSTRTARTRSRFAAGVALVVAVGLTACSDDAETATTAPPVEAPTTSTSVAPVSGDLDHELAAILAGAVADPVTRFAGTALALHDGQLGSWAGAAGVGDLATTAPMAAGDRFRAGSILKPFVATVVLQLAEEGVIGLDDPITSTVAPAITDRFVDADHITVRMLLNHTSGIPNYADETFDSIIAHDPGRVWSLDELLDRAASKPPTGSPGAVHAYSNTNFNLLGVIVETVTDAPWRDAVRERIIEPLGLTRTELPEPGTTVDHVGLAHGYQIVDGVVTDLSDVDSSMADAGGGNALVTTTEDLVTFIDALMAGELFDDAGTLDEMLTFVDAVEDTGLTGYGLGLERYVMPGGVEVIGHVGGTAGYLSIVGHVTGRDLSIAMTINAPDDPLPVLLPALERVLACGDDVRCAP